MKTKFLLFALCTLLFAISASSQTTAPLAFRMDLITCLQLQPKTCDSGDADAILTVIVKDYNVYKTSSGQYYVNYTNSTGTISRKYLGYKFGGTQEYEGNTIFFSADTVKCWIWTVDRYGQIYKMDLPDYFATDRVSLKDTIR